ncbi:tetratricopeptide repeat protein [Nocardia abscessus]|uniref:tetratricopeptide repeat protein n=1 Tax=Nocardia abscessus TaxID=120957 RepID=UPI002456CB2B|nr:tetratricopeptide repeat protein [Nocardia abscessus]
MNEAEPGHPQPDTPAASGVPAAGVHASGPRAVAVGGNAGAVQTGDNSRIVQLSAEAWQSIAEVDAPPGIDNLPVQPGHGFVGRDAELGKLDTVLAEPGRVVVQAVHGLGGIGKSTLVAHWAATRPHGHRPILWVTADTAADVRQGLAKFAAALQPALAQALEVEQLAERALQWLSTHTGWLLILDNVNDLTDIHDVLARTGTGGRIIITSRRSTGWQPGTAIVRLDVLEPDESLRLLTGLLTAAGPRDCDGAAELCAQLGHLPLAIEQAGAYLAQNPLTTPRDYLRLLTDYPAAMYEQAAVDVDPERTIARIWQVTLDRITTARPAAADLLRVLAWYGPDAIPITLCRNLADPPTLNTALGVLTAYSMITLDPATNSVSIHRLVQAVARTPDPHDPHRRLDAIERAHTSAATNLHLALPPREDPTTWPTWRALLPHIDALLSYTTTDTVPTTAILNDSALFFLDQGMFVRATEYLHRALAAREQILRADHPHTLASGNNLASAYQKAGRIAEAIKLLEQILPARERVLGPDHPNTLGSRNNLASAYRVAGRTAEAIKLYEQVLTDADRILGIDHPHTLTSRNNLAGAYDKAGRTAEAIKLYEQVLIDRERVLGPDHPDTLTSRNNLAYAYASAGRTDEAIPVLEQTLADRERVLGPDHPDTVTCRNNLAYAYQAAGRTAAAIKWLEQVLLDRERALGSDHPDTVTSRNNLATAYRAAGRTAEAIKLYEQALAVRERVLGPDHPDTLQSRNNLATAYQAAGRIAEAIKLCEQVLFDRERVLGPDHPDTLGSRNNLAYAYRAAGRTAEAIKLYEQLLANAERVLGPDHPITVTVRSNLVQALKFQREG